ncbi:hypothetical protein GIX45_02895 [Erwinia sp. CPCC 100877]|nr:hypothetical protein [Erwinia sp. CPCC 100877]
MLKKYDEAFLELIQEYQLMKQQPLYTGTSELPLKIASTSSFIHPIAGIEEKRLTNFFVLDERKDVHLYTTNSEAKRITISSQSKKYSRAKALCNLRLSLHGCRC